MPLPANGVRVGGRVVVIRDGQFVGKKQKKGRLLVDRKARRTAKPR
jgi:hypothetical protein